MEIQNRTDRPFISIVMPVYNNERLLPFAVNSIIEQSFPNWELIIIDDGSTDGTAQVADVFACKDRRIQVVHQENQGIFTSYNTGYRLAAGEYVFIVNSDDTINPDSLQAIHDVAVIDQADMILFNMELNLCDKDQVLVEKDPYHYAGRLKETFSCRGKENVRKLWPHFIQQGLINQQCIYRETVYKAFSYQKRYYMEDVFYNQSIADTLSSVAGTAYIVYNYYHYLCEGMNASCGRYYGYEHEMFNEYYSENKRLFQKWGMMNAETANIIASERLTRLTIEIRRYSAPRCSLTTGEKIRRIIEDASDDVMYDCVSGAGRTEEWESRILSGVREILVNEPLDSDDSYYFVYELLDCLLRYEKDEEDIRKIRAAVYHGRNPRRIGKTFLQKLGLDKESFET